MVLQGLRKVSREPSCTPVFDGFAGRWLAGACLAGSRSMPTRRRSYQRSVVSLSLWHGEHTVLDYHTYRVLHRELDGVIQQ